MKHHSRIRGRSRRGARRPEIAGTVIRCLAFLVLVAACVLGVQWARDGVHRSLVLNEPTDGPSLTVLAGLPQPQVQVRSPRLVYPYSVIPGGVRSVAELRDRTAHDPVVAQHYAGFDFARARVTAVVQPRLVYLSYRRGQHIYWTRKQASLRQGETLITDGHITARSRCGNQVSALPHTETSPEEPTMAELDRPAAMASGIDQPFNSNLLNLDPILPLGPAQPGEGGIAGGPGIDVPPPIGGGGGGINPSTGGNCPPKSTSKDCQHNPPPPTPPPPTPPPPKPPGPSPVPEPSTVLLMISGAAAVFTRLRGTKK